MNLYSQKLDGSVAPVEKEMPVPKDQKRKVAPKKTKKVAEPEVEKTVTEDQVVPTVEKEQTYEELVKELEALSDVEPESVAETVVTEEPEPVTEPVEIKKPKRKPRVPKAVAPTAPPPTPKSQPDDDDEPPKWFMNYVSNMKTFQNEVAEKKKPKRVLKNESDDYAKQQWKKPDLRQRVTDSVDSHLTKMYRQIFSNRG